MPYYRGQFYWSDEEIVLAKKERKQKLKEEKRRIEFYERVAKFKLQQQQQGASQSKAHTLLHTMAVATATLQFEETLRDVVKNNRYDWAQYYDIFPNAEVRCCYCGVGIPTGVTWVVSKERRQVLHTFRYDHALGKWRDYRYFGHPHVSEGGNICMGNSQDTFSALFLGLNPHSAYNNVKDWLKMRFQHECWNNSPHAICIGGNGIAPCECYITSCCQQPACQCAGNIVSRTVRVYHAWRGLPDMALPNPNNRSEIISYNELQERLRAEALAVPSL